MDERRSADVLLVLNKAESSGGDVEAIRAAIAEVVEPFGLSIDHLVRTEARDWLDAEAEQDQGAAADLRAASGVHALEAAIDGLAAAHGLTARLTRPLHEIRRLAGAAAAAIAPPDEEETVRVEALEHELRLLDRSEERLRGRVRSLLSDCAGKVERCGDAASVSVTAEIDEAAVRRAVDAQTARVRGLKEDAERDIGAAIAMEWSDLLRQLDGQKQDLIGCEILPARREAASIELAELSKRPDVAQADGKYLYLTGAGKFAMMAEKIGSFLGRAASGPKATADGFLAVTGAARSTAHQIIYEAGKIVGYNFRPWEAARYAQVVGNVGKVLGVLGGAVGVAAAYVEERREQATREAVAEARRTVRGFFRSHAALIEEDGMGSFERVVADSYGAEARSTALLVEAILSKASKRVELAAPLLSVAKRAGELAERIGGNGTRS